MSLRSFVNWKGLLTVGCIAFLAVAGISQFAQPTYAAGLRDTCNADTDCNSAPECDVAGYCQCIGEVETLGTPGLCGRSTEAAAEFATETVRDAAEGTVAEDLVESTLGTSDACGTSNGLFMGFICQGILFILGAIVELLGKLVLLILSVLLAFAKYNGFAAAAPVQVGWPIVRDICNMFFIIVLLVSAFSTIIDYGGGELHYSKVLPRLLAMAVLINFSKTLIQLLIDFSQVVMLTFVNAFAAAASGNFVNALGLTAVMQISENAGTGTATGVNLIISYMLAIFMLGIMLSVVSILTGFLIFRIIGLWIALIFSPLAFFVTALPGKLSKAVSGLAGEYWQRLGSLLTGGPIIAFFLWLTLAIVQQANTGSVGQGLSQVLDFDVEAGSLQAFLVSVGNAQSIASFIVGIALLMMGLDQAVKVSGQIGSTFLSQFAQRAKGAGMSIGRLGALAPFLAAGYGVRAGARAGYRAVDQRVDLTASASRAGLWATNKLANAPIAGALGGRALRSAVRPTLARGLTMRREEAAKQGAEEKKLLSNVDKFATDEELKLVGKAQSFSGSALRTMGARAASMTAAEVLSTDALRDRESKRTEAKYVTDLMASGMSEPDAKSGSKVLAERDSQREQTDLIQKRLELAKGAGDRDTVEALEKAIKASPMLAADANRDKVIEDVAKDPDKYKDISKMDAMSGQVLTGMMLQHGYKKDASGALVLDDAAAYDRLKTSVEASGNKQLQQGLEAHESFVTNSPGITVDKAKTLQHRFNAGDKTVQSFDVSKGLGGEWDKAKNSAGVDVLKAGTRVYTDNYKKADSDLQNAKVLRAAGTLTTPADNTKIAKQFIENNGTLPDYISKAQISDADTVPLETLKAEMETNLSSGMAALYGGDAQKANTEIQFTGKVLNQLDRQGVKASTQVELISAAAKGLGNPLTGKVDATFIRNIERLHPTNRDAIVTLVETTKKRADDLVQQATAAGKALTTAEQQVVDLSDTISKEIESNKKNINSRILNAYRPGRGRTVRP